MKFKFLGRTVEIRASAVTSVPSPGNDAAWIAYLLGRGYPMDAEKALQISAVFRCVDIITKTISSLPLNLYHETTNGKEKASQHCLQQMVHFMPNHQTTAYEFWQMYVANLLLTNGAYAKIQRDSRGFITSLWNIPTSNCSGIQMNTESGERYIDVTLADGRYERLREGEFLYTSGFLFNNRNTAANPMRIASEVLGLSGTIAGYARSAVDGINPGGFIEYPAGLSDKAYERFKTEFNENYRGAMNAGKFLFLEEGGKANLFERDMEKMQVLETRKWLVTEVCRIWGVPAHLCMDMEHATFSNIEQQSTEYVRDCINPLSVRLEQSMYRDLLTTTEQSTYYFKFNTNALLRGDTQTRAQYYNTMRQTGVMTANEIRELEEMDRKPADTGADDLHVNGNMITLAAAAKTIPKGAQASARKGA